MRIAQFTAAAFVLLLVNTAYIGAFAEPTIFYMGNVLLHVALGALVYVLAIRSLPKPVAVVAFAVFATGAFLTWKGAVLPNQKVLWAHIGAGVLVALLAGFHFPKLRTATLGAAAAARAEDRESDGGSGVDGGRGRGAEEPVLAIERADERRWHDSFGLLHGFEAVRRMPQGRLRAMELLGPSLRQFQQSVLPEID